MLVHQRVCQNEKPTGSPSCFVRNLAPSPKKSPDQLPRLHLEHSKELGDVLMLTRSHHYHLGCPTIFLRTLRGLPLEPVSSNKKKHGNKQGKPRASMGDEIRRSKNGGCWGREKHALTVSLAIGSEMSKTHANLAGYELSTNSL